MSVDTGLIAALIFSLGGLIALISISVGFRLGQETIIIMQDSPDDSSQDDDDVDNEEDDETKDDEADDEATKVEKLRKRIEKDKTNKFFD